MARENHTQYALLGLLSHESQSGYDIKKAIEYSISNFWNIGYGQIYPELKKLESKKLVTCNIVTPESGPSKKIYSITKEGHKELLGWLKKDVTGESYRFELLLKLYFSSNVDLEFTVEKIKNFRNRREATLEKYNMLMESLKSVLNDNKDHKYMYLTLLFGFHIEKAFLSWADEAKELIKEF